MNTKKLVLILASTIAGVAIAICILALTGSGAAFSASQAAQRDPAFPPPVSFLTGSWPDYASEALSATPYPPRAGEPTHLCAVLQSNDLTQTYTPTLQFSVTSGFGIGLALNPIASADPIVVPPMEQVNVCVTWVPPFAGNFVFGARLVLAGYPDQDALRAMDVDEPLQPNTPHSLVFIVRNPTSNPATITLGLIPHPPGWSISLSQDVFNLAGGGVAPCTLTVTPPDDLWIDESVVVDVEGYIGTTLIGGIRKTFSAPLILHHPPDPIFAESEITINPYPPAAGQPTEICALLDNHTAYTQTGTLRFSVANFGIGSSFDPISSWMPLSIEARGQQSTCTTWVPPTGGLFDAQVELALAGLPVQVSQRNVEQIIPNYCGEHELVFPLQNSSGSPATVSLGLSTSHLPPLEWYLALVPSGPFAMDSGEILPVKLEYSIPCDPTDYATGLSAPPEWPVLNVEAIIGGELFSGIQFQFSPQVIMPLYLPVVRK